VFSLLLLLIFISIAFTIGNLVLKAFHFDYRHKFEKYSLSVSLGLGILALAVFSLGLISIYVVEVFIALSFILTLFHYKKLLVLFKDILFYVRKIHELSVLSKILLAIFLITALLNLLSAMAPITSIDALAAHFAFPKIYLQNMRIIEVPWDHYSYLPSLMQMLNLIALIFKSDTLGTLFHYSYGILIVLILYSMVRPYGIKYALFAAVVFYSSGMVTWESTSSFIDLAITFNVLAAFYLYFIFKKDKNYASLMLSALFMSFAVFSKLTGLIVASSLFFILIIDSLTNKKDKVVMLSRQLGVFFGIIFIVNIPWMIKNFIYTGSPFFPFMSSFFKVKPQFSFALESMHSSMVAYGMGKDLISFLLTPIYLFVKGSLYDYGGLYGAIVVSVLPLLIVSLRRAEGRRIVFALVFFYSVWFFASQQSRFFLPFFPLALFAIIYEMKSILDSNKILKKVALIVVISALLFNLSVNLVYNSSLIPAALGFVDRDNFLENSTFTYKDTKWMNSKLEKEGKLLTFAKGLYYLDIPYIKGNYLMHRFSLIKDITREGVLKYLRDNEVKYVYVFSEYNTKNNEWIFETLLANNLKLLYKDRSEKYMRRTLKRKPFINESKVYQIVFD